MMKRVARYALLTFGLLALLFAGCLGYPDVPESVRQARSNELDEVFGQVELFVPAERKAGSDYLSPDGRWLIVSFSRPIHWVLIDLITMAEHPIELECVSKNNISFPLADALWLEPTRFVAANAHLGCYYLVNAEDGISRQLPLVPEDETLLRSADLPVYITKSLGRGGFSAFALGDEPFAMHLHNPEDATQPPAWTATIPHIIEVPRPKTGWVQPFPSRTQCFYATGGDQEVSLYSSEGQLLARAAKDGWSFRVLGWAHDDSAIFVRAVIGGGADGGILYPWLVIWKLDVPEGAACEEGK